MASFILIHGSWHGGWCFDTIKGLLKAAGHEVIAPDLPGMGGDEVELRATTLQGLRCKGLSLSLSARPLHRAISRLAQVGHIRWLMP